MIDKKDIREISKKINMPEEKVNVDKEIEKCSDEIDALSAELSKKSDLSKDEIKSRLKETLRDLAKPSLNNMDSPCSLIENCSCK